MNRRGRGPVARTGARLVVLGLVGLVGLVASGLAACSSGDEPAERSAGSASPASNPGQTSGPARLYAAACEGSLTVGPGVDLPDDLAEISGLAAHSTAPGVVWALGDGGSAASVFAVDLTGSIVAVVALDGATNHDWEDLALGPAPDGTGGAWLYVADIGDNSSERERVRVLAFPEPEFDETTVAPLELVADYSTGPTDAEAFAVTDDGLWILGKEWGGGDAPLYRLEGASFGPLGATDEPTATFAPTGGTVDADLVTAMDAAADTRVLAVRTYGDLYLFDQTRPDLVPVTASPPCATPPVVEAQGESVAVTPDGRSIITASEAGSVQPAQLHVISLSGT